MSSSLQFNAVSILILMTHESYHCLLILKDTSSRASQSLQPPVELQISIFSARNTFTIGCFSKYQLPSPEWDLCTLIQLWVWWNWTTWASNVHPKHQFYGNSAWHHTMINCKLKWIVVSWKNLSTPYAKPQHTEVEHPRPSSPSPDPLPKALPPSQ